MTNPALENAIILAYCRKTHFFKYIKNLEAKIDAWCEAYSVDILVELKKMTAYLVSNPNRRYRDYGRFIQRWLSRTADQGGMKEVMQTLAAGMAGPSTSSGQAKCLSRSTPNKGRPAVLSLSKGKEMPTQKPVDYAARRKLLMQQNEELKRREENAKN